MKKVTFIALFIMIAIFAIAQSPFYFNYQAAVRNNQNQVLANQNVSLKFSILENSETGTVVFTETHNTQSSALGIVNLQIGKGQNQTGSLSSLNWKNKAYWLKVEMDDTGGNNYKEMGISQLVSVPYALHAETATYVDDADANPQNELQTLSFNTANNELSISNGNSITIPTGGTDADADPQNEIQTLSKNGNTISLSKNGGSVTDEVDDADANPQNELQTLSFNSANNELSISNGNSVTIPTGGTDADADPKNEIQTLSKNGNIISLSKNGGSVTDAVDDADADPQNELQNLSLAGNTLSISKGNQVDLSYFESYWKKTSSWKPNGIEHIGPVFMDTVFVDWQLKVGDNNPYGTQIYQKNFFMNDNVLNTNLSLNANTLEFEEDANIDYSKLSKDSLFFRFDPGGLVWPITSTLGSNGLKSQSLINESHLDAYGLNIKDDQYESFWNNKEWGIKQQLSTSDIFDRISIKPDNLIMYNDAKWKYIQLGKDPDFGTGMLKIMDMGGNGEKAHIVGSDSYDGGGAMFHLLGLDGNIKAEMETPDDIGLLSLYGRNDSRLIFAVSDGMYGGGYMEMCDTLSQAQIAMWVDRDRVPIGLTNQDTVISMGHIYSSEDIASISFQSVEEDSIHSEMNNGGFITDGTLILSKDPLIRYPDPFVFYIIDPVTIIKKGEADEAIAEFYGKNGNLNAKIFAQSPGLSDDADYGAVYVYNDQGIAQAGIEVEPNTGNGIVWGNSKQFRIPYPDKPDKEIVYASIEGPETAVYARGTATLKAGEAYVQLPDYFTSISNTKSMTVILTPLDWDTYGLAAIEKSEKGFKVKELKGGKGNFAFDWEVKAVRKGYEDFKVVRDKPVKKECDSKKVYRKNQRSNKHPGKILNYKYLRKQNIISQ